MQTLLRKRFLLENMHKIWGNDTMNRKIVETDIEQLSKTVKAMESKQERELKQAVQQYNQVVQQNKNLQTERNIYRNALEEIKKIIDKDRDERNHLRLTAVSVYSIFEKLQEVL